MNGKLVAIVLVLVFVLAVFSGGNSSSSSHSYSSGSSSSSYHSSGYSSGSSSYSSSGSHETGITGAGGYDMPNESDETFSDYVKRVDPELYDTIQDRYNEAVSSGY